MQSQSYVYGPDGEEGWYFQDEIPEGWSADKPEDHENKKTDSIAETAVDPTSEPDHKTASEPEQEQPPQVADAT